MHCEADCQLYALNYYDLLALEDLSFEFVLLCRKIAYGYLCQINQERDLYRRSNAAEKYSYLCQQYSGIGNYVKQKDLASYLGITQQSFSRMLKEGLTKTH